VFFVVELQYAPSFLPLFLQPFPLLLFRTLLSSILILRANLHSCSSMTFIVCVPSYLSEGMLKLLFLLLFLLLFGYFRACKSSSHSAMCVHSSLDNASFSNNELTDIRESCFFESLCQPSPTFPPCLDLEVS